MRQAHGVARPAEQCSKISATGSQFCHNLRDSAKRAGKDRLTILTAIQEGRNGGSLLEVVRDSNTTHVIASQELCTGDIATFVSGEKDGK
jgi:hypothetical protein